MKKRVKVLMITPYLPYPPASGGQIRTYNLLKYLSKNVDVYLVSLYKRKSDLKFIPQLKKITKEVYPCKREKNPWSAKLLFKALFSPYPYLVIRNYSEEAAKTIKRLLTEKDFDLIHAETFYVMPLISETKLPILLAEQTIEFLVYKRFVADLSIFIRPFFYPEIIKLSFWEKYYWKKATLVAPVSKIDERIIKAVSPKIKTLIIPNGAGDEMFVKKLPKKDLSQPKILFIGNFLWIQNLEPAEFLINKLSPILEKELPNAKIIIAGQHLKEKIKPERRPKNIELIDIPENQTKKIRKLYEEATFFAAPITGPGGTRLKILAAMASGLPIIATKTAVEGLDLKNNQHFLQAETPIEYVKAIKKLTQKPETYYKIQKNAYELVKKEYSWEKIAEKLRRVYQNLKK